MSIKLSPKHGVNPTIPKCFYCFKDKNEIILPGRLPGDQETPKGMVWDTQPCDECAEYMKKGIILISAKEDGDPYNPYRTGGWVVVTEDYIKRCVTDKTTCDQILMKRVSFIPDDIWDRLGLPRQRTQRQERE